MRYAIEPDADTDNSLSTQPDAEVCETCGEPCLEAIWAAHGQYAFCSDKCRDDYYAALENL